MADVGPCCIGPVPGSAWRKGSADPRRGSRAISAMYQRVCMKMDSVVEGTCSPICIGTVVALEKGNLALLSSPSPQSPRFAPGQHGACGPEGVCFERIRSRVFAARTSEKQTPEPPTYSLTLPVATYSSALTIAAATLLPPLRPRATIQGTFSSSMMSSFDSVTFTKPTGTPMIAQVVWPFPCR